MKSNKISTFDINDDMNLLVTGFDHTKISEYYKTAFSTIYRVTRILNQSTWHHEFLPSKFLTISKII